MQASLSWSVPSGGALGRQQPRSAAWRPSAAPRWRRHCRPPLLRSTAAQSAASSDGPGAHLNAGGAVTSEFERMVASGKLTKSAVGKLAVVELRAECARLQLPTDGLKAALVERLMTWWQQQRQQEQQQEQQQAQQQEQAKQKQGQQDKQPAADSPAAAPSASAAANSTPAPAASAASAAPAVGAPAAAAARHAQTAASQQQQPAGGSGAAPQREGQQQQNQQQRQAGRQAEHVSVTWLGTSSGSPTPRRNVSGIAVRFDDDLYLVDSGEGTRHQMRRARLDAARVRRVFVTHMHGDHCFGLGGLIEEVCQARLGTPLQHEPLYIYGPPEVHSLVITAVRLGSIQLTTPVVATGFVLDARRARPPTKVDEAGMLQVALQGPDQGDRVPPQLAAGWQAAYDSGSERIVQMGLSWTVRIPGGPLVAAAQLQHRVPCWGYVFQEPPTTSVGAAAAAAAPEAAAAAERPPQQQQWVRRGRKLVILGDTCDSSAIAPLALGCDLLSHEATFCSGMEEKAQIAQHSTTEQAGAFAAAVDAQALVLTHFSARYESVSGVSMNYRSRGGGSGGRGGQQQQASKRQVEMAVVGGDLKRQEMMRLLEETHRTYGRDGIYLAHDFYTHAVPAPPPVLAEQYQQAAAQQAQQAQQWLSGHHQQQQLAQGQARMPRQQQYQQQYGRQQRQGGGGQQYQRRRLAGDRRMR